VAKTYNLRPALYPRYASLCLVFATPWCQDAHATKRESDFTTSAGVAHPISRVLPWPFFLWGVGRRIKGKETKTSSVKGVPHVMGILSVPGVLDQSYHGITGHQEARLMSHVSFGPVSSPPKCPLAPRHPPPPPPSSPPTRTPHAMGGETHENDGKRVTGLRGVCGHLTEISFLRQLTAPRWLSLL
jgi:hypothetical protein